MDIHTCVIYEQAQIQQKYRYSFLNKTGSSLRNQPHLICYQSNQNY